MYALIETICEAVARGVTRGIIKELREAQTASREKVNDEDISIRDNFADLVNGMLHPTRADGDPKQSNPPPNSGGG